MSLQSMKPIRRVVLFLIALVFLLTPMQSVKAAEEEYFDFVQELVFQAYFFPDDSYEIRFLLAELLGYDGREVKPGWGPEDVKAYQEEYGALPSQMPVMELEVLLRKDFVDGRPRLEYHRAWLSLVDGKVHHQFLAVGATAWGDVENLDALETLWNHWHRMSLTERDWVDRYFDDEQLEDGNINLLAQLWFEQGQATEKERATDAGLTVIEEVSMGVWMGDGAPVELGTVGIATQVIVGFIPVAGQIGDIRDTYYALEDIVDSGGEEGVTALAFAAVAFIPGGDAAKGGRKGLRAADEAAEIASGAAKAPNPAALKSFAQRQGKELTPPKSSGSIKGGSRTTSATGRLRSRLGDPPSNMKKPQAHHDLTQKYRKKFERAELDIDDPAFGRWVEGGPVGNHQKWSAEFNREWGNFFKKNPNATKTEILQFMKRMRIDPRFQ